MKAVSDKLSARCSREGDDNSENFHSCEMLYGGYSARNGNDSELQCHYQQRRLFLIPRMSAAHSRANTRKTVDFVARDDQEANCATGRNFGRPKSMSLNWIQDRTVKWRFSRNSQGRSDSRCDKRKGYRPDPTHKQQARYNFKYQYSKLFPTVGDIFAGYVSSSYSIYLNDLRPSNGHNTYWELLAPGPLHPTRKQTDGNLCPVHYVLVDPKSQPR